MGPICHNPGIPWLTLITHAGEQLPTDRFAGQGVRRASRSEGRSPASRSGMAGHAPGRTGGGGGGPWAGGRRPRFSRSGEGGVASDRKPRVDGRSMGSGRAPTRRSEPCGVCRLVRKPGAGPCAPSAAARRPRNPGGRDGWPLPSGPREGFSFSAFGGKG